MSDTKIFPIGELKQQVKDAGKAPPWELFTLKDAYQEREPLRYIINGLFALPSLSIVYGAPGTLKSMFLVDALAHVAGGEKWLGREVIQAPALWIDFDNGRRRTHERIAAVSRHLELTPDVPLYYVSMPNPPLDAGDRESIDALGALITSKGIRFMVIDNLTLISPNNDENSDGMAKVMGNMRMLSENAGCAIVIIHHQRKTKEGRGGTVGETLRGHSSIAASVDLALLIKRMENSDNIEAHSTKTRDVDVYPFGAEYRYDHKDQTIELLTSTCVPCKTEIDIANADQDETIIKIVSESGGGIESQHQLAKKAKERVGKVGLSTLKNRIRRLEDLKILLVKPGPNNSKRYVVNPNRDLP